MKKKSFIAFIVCYAAYTSIYIARLNLTMAAAGLRGAGHATEAQIGLLGSVFAVVYACGRLINGALSDKVRPAFMMTVGLALCGMANIGFGFLPPFAALLLLWGTNAFAQSMLWSSVLCVVAFHYPPEKAKKKTSVMVTAVATGNILGILLNMLIVEYAGLAWAFFLPGLLTLIAGAVVLTTLHKVPAVQAQTKHQSIFALLKERSVRLALIPAVLHGTVKDNISLWMAVYFVDRYCIDLKRSSLYILFIPAVGLAGRLAYPLLYKLCGEKEHKVSLVGFIIAAACCVPLLIPGNPSVLAMLCLGVLYAAISVINTSFLSICPMRYLKSGNVASVGGLMDFATYLGAGIGSLSFGFLIARGGYEAMFAVWAAVSLLAIIPVAILMKKDA